MFVCVLFWYCCVKRTTRIMYKIRKHLFSCSTRGYSIGFMLVTHSRRISSIWIIYSFVRLFVIFAWRANKSPKKQQHGNKNRCRYNKNKNQKSKFNLGHLQIFELRSNTPVSNQVNINKNEPETTIKGKKALMLCSLSFLFFCFCFIVERQYHNAELRRQSTTRRRHTYTIHIDYTHKWNKSINFHFRNKAHNWIQFLNWFHSLFSGQKIVVAH